MQISLITRRNIVWFETQVTKFNVRPTCVFGSGRGKAQVVTPGTTQRAEMDSVMVEYLPKPMNSFVS